MFFSLSLVIVVSNLVLLNASPVTSSLAGSGHRVPLVRNSRFRQNTTLAINRARARLQSFALDAQGNKRDTGHVDMLDYDDFEYLGEVGVGTPPQMFHLQFDTGSSDLWLDALNCQQCSPHVSRFDPNQSATYQEEGKPWRIAYLDNSEASGITARDTIYLGGITIENQRVQMALHETSDFNDDPTDGMLGLGFSKRASVPGTLTPLDNMVAQNLVQEPIFGVYLGSNGNGGEFIFGSYDSQYDDSDFTRVPVQSETGHWQITVDGIQVGDHVSSTPFKAVVDTGTSIMVFDPIPAKAIADQVGAKPDPLEQGTFTMPCDSNVPVTFLIGNSKIEMDSRALVGTPTWFGDCYANFATSPRPIGIALLGDSFLKHFYTIFDYGTPEIRFAELK
ncbi:extracellular aspartic proteinase [Hesseltinella vesiculosa]|uniref:rhizopuspepsin n=1 Tax=Hesseltinella vesiculosa TaxID=101127 RepID=A0A1X2GVP3_9FUNG|nr:extracellular aspartic proteinase [Hesseltinella vesiculosa]